MDSYRFSTVESGVDEATLTFFFFFFLAILYSLPVDRDFFPGESYFQCALYSFFVLPILHIHFQTLPYHVDAYIKLSYLY